MVTRARPPLWRALCVATVLLSGAGGREGKAGGLSDFSFGV